MDFVPGTIFSPQNVIKVLVNEYGAPGKNPSPLEKDIGRYLIDILNKRFGADVVKSLRKKPERSYLSTEFDNVIENVIGKHIMEEGKKIELKKSNDESDQENEQSSNDSDYDPEGDDPENFKIEGLNPFGRKYTDEEQKEIVAYYRSTKSGRRSFKAMKMKYRRLTSESSLYSVIKRVDRLLTEPPKPAKPPKIKPKRVKKKKIKEVKLGADGEPISKQRVAKLGTDGLPVKRKRRTKVVETDQSVVVPILDTPVIKTKRTRKKKEKSDAAPIQMINFDDLVVESDNVEPLQEPVVTQYITTPQFSQNVSSNINSTFQSCQYGTYNSQNPSTKNSYQQHPNVVPTFVPFAPYFNHHV